MALIPIVAELFTEENFPNAVLPNQQFRKLPPLSSERCALRFFVIDEGFCRQTLQHIRYGSRGGVHGCRNGVGGSRFSVPFGDFKNGFKVIFFGLRNHFFYKSSYFVIKKKLL